MRECTRCKTPTNRITQNVPICTRCFEEYKKYKEDFAKRKVRRAKTRHWIFRILSTLQRWTGIHFISPWFIQRMRARRLLTDKVTKK